VSTRATQDRRTRGARLLLALLLALLANGGLLTLLVLQSEAELIDLPAPSAMRVRLTPEEPPAPETKLEGQVVEIEPPKRQERPDEARYLAQFDSRVETETKARPRPDRKPAKARRPPAPPRPEAKPEAAPRAAERSILFQKPGARPLRPSEGAEDLAEAAEALASTDVFVSDDALLDVNEVGERTNLNARQFRYWDFFQRVRQRVKEQWRPNEAYQRRDPTWSIYQRQNRLTVLQVVLDRDGNVVTARQVRKSGLGFLDDEALRAFTSAGPFANPPAGLADESGRIVFNFGFYLELNGGMGGFW